MWRFTQQRNDVGERLNIYHVEEVGKTTKEVIGVFVFMNASHADAERLSEHIELYTTDEMDDEFEDGRREGYKEADSPPPPPPSSEAPPSPSAGLPLEPLEETPLRVV